MDFVGTSPFLRTLPFAMATMHFYMAQTGVFRNIISSHLGGPRERFGTHEKLSF